MIQRCLRHGLLFFFIVCCAIAATAVSTERLIHNGDSAYAIKAYDFAARSYEQATASGGGALTYYRLGNAYYRLKRTGEAVLAYERALKRQPGFSAAADNLAVIQQQVQLVPAKDEVFLFRWWRMLTKPSMSNIWAILGIACFCFPLINLAWSRFARKISPWLRPQLVTGLIILGIFFAALAAVSVYSEMPHNIAVVMRQDAVLHSALKSGGKADMMNLPEGLVVKVLQKEKEKVLISLPDGRTGMIQPSDIALVE